MPRACVVIPTRNEANSIEGVLQEIRAAFAGTRYDDLVLLVVDDSNDRTRQIARAAGAEVISGGGDGLGSAMYNGLKWALRYRPDVILAVDGDGQADPQEIRRFLAPIEEDRADMVVGSRFLGDASVHYRYPSINRFGTRVLSGILTRATGQTFTDSHGGLRAMRPEVVADLELLGTFTYVQETIIDAVEKGHRVVEVASDWRVRRHGKSRVVRSIPKYVFYTLPILLLRSGHHIRWLYSGGLISIALAIAVFLIVLVQEEFSWAMLHRTPAFVLVGMLMSVGVQLFGLGFILQLLKQIKRTADRAYYRTQNGERDHESRGAHDGR